VSAAEHCAPLCCTQQKMIAHKRMQERREFA